MRAEKSLYLLIGSLMLIATAACAEDWSRTNSDGQVTVRAVFENPGEPTPRFAMRMDTHTVNLDAFDVAANARLKDDGGNEYRGTWEDTGGGGHHRQGTLAFGAVDASRTQTLTLEISNLGGVESRSFRWDVR